jgi:hypothetical protein
MKESFTIRFNFPLDHSSIIVKLEAIVTIHHSETYYQVHGFNYTHHEIENEVSLLPEQELILLERDGMKRWVHKDSERETQLSTAIGKAIEEELGL